MPAADPCKGCKFDGFCLMRGQVNRLAIEAWLADERFECEDYEMETYHGIEGVKP